MKESIVLSNKTLQKLALITFLVTVPLLVILYQSGGSAIKSKNTPLFPGMVTDLGLLSKLTVEDHDQTLTLERNNDTWILVERNNYPVATSNVQDLVSSLAALRIIEPKTKSPALYAQLDVDEVNQPDSKAVKITLYDNNQQAVAAVLIGKRDGVLEGDQYIERLFARKPADQQTWLLQGILPLSNNVKDWLDQPLLGIVPAEKLKKLAIKRPQFDALVMAKLNAEEQDFKLENANVTPGMQLDVDAINTLPFEVSEIEILDVLSSDQANIQQMNIDWQQGVQAQLETFDGVSVALDVVKHDDKIFAKVSAVVPEDAQDEIKQQVSIFNASHQSWYYQLSPEAYKTLNLASTDLLRADDQPITESPIN